MSQEELEIERGELAATRRKEAAEKMALQSQLTELNAACATRLPNAEFQTIQRQRAEIIAQLGRKEGDLGILKAKIIEVQTAIDIGKTKAIIPVPIVKELMRIRDHWHGFSMDGHNHQKAREVAWKVSQELRSLLAAYFKE